MIANNESGHLNVIPSGKKHIYIFFQEQTAWAELHESFHYNYQYWILYFQVESHQWQNTSKSVWIIFVLMLESAVSGDLTNTWAIIDHMSIIIVSNNAYQVAIFVVYLSPWGICTNRCLFHSLSEPVCPILRA